MGEGVGPRPRVLILEDDGEVAELIVEILTTEGFDARRADHRSEPAAIVRERPELLLLDLCLGEREGAEILAGLRRSGLGREVPVVLLSGKPDLEREARAVGASATLNKPFEIDKLVQTCWSLTR